VKNENNAKKIFDKAWRSHEQNLIMEDRYFHSIYAKMRDNPIPLPSGVCGLP
jgi:hypothetical protein